MKRDTLYFDILGLYVVFKTDSNELLHRIEKDFSFFKKAKVDKEKFIEITSYFQRPDYSILKNKKKWKESKNSITYDVGETRYNDYHGKLLSIYDYTKGKGILWSIDIEKLHEITYLLILSLTGKKLDLLGFHKVHAMGIVYRDVCLIGMMDSGVGKSTLLGELLVDPEVHLLSDDTPLVDKQGRFLPFPLRLGLEDIPKDLLIKNPQKNLYHLKREFFGLKTLICIDGLKNSVASTYKKLMIFEGRRIKGEECLIQRQNRMRFLYSLSKHMIIGIGLPIIFEYFWRSGFRDFLTKTHIALKRGKCALSLIMKHEFYTIGLGENPKKNANKIKDIMNSLLLMFFFAGINFFGNSFLFFGLTFSTVHFKS